MIRDSRGQPDMVRLTHATRITAATLMKIVSRFGLTLPVWRRFSLGPELRPCWDALALEAETPAGLIRTLLTSSDGDGSDATGLTGPKLTNRT